MCVWRAHILNEWCDLDISKYMIKRIAYISNHLLQIETGFERPNERFADTTS